MHLWAYVFALSLSLWSSRSASTLLPDFAHLLSFFLLCSIIESWDKAIPVLCFASTLCSLCSVLTMLIALGTDVLYTCTENSDFKKSLKVINSSYTSENVCKFKVHFFLTRKFYVGRCTLRTQHIRSLLMNKISFLFILRSLSIVAVYGSIPAADRAKKRLKFPDTVSAGIWEWDTSHYMQNIKEPFRRYSCFKFFPMPFQIPLWRRNLFIGITLHTLT